MIRNIPALSSALFSALLTFALFSLPAQSNTTTPIAVLQAMPCLGTLTSLSYILTGLLAARLICAGRGAREASQEN